jgi:hypothetical protein
VVFIAKDDAGNNGKQREEGIKRVGRSGGMQ